MFILRYMSEAVHNAKLEIKAIIFSEKKVTLIQNIICI